MQNSNESLEPFNEDDMFDRNSVKPSEIDISNGLCGSRLGEAEKETFACNIISMNAQNGDAWRPLTMKQYEANRPQDDHRFDDWTFGDLVRDGMLTQIEGEYDITDAFIKAVSKFIRTKR
jgi:hypothetical protein